MNSSIQVLANQILTQRHERFEQCVKFVKFSLKLHIILIMMFLFALYGCQPGQIPKNPSITVVPSSTSTPRWVIYEKALSKAIVNTGDGLCEWDILGNSGNEVFVWALCKVREPIGTAGSVPAVIKLGQNGGIEKVTIPRDGIFYPEDIQSLFPADIQKKVFHSDFNGPEAEKLIDERLKDNGPPLIAISGTPLP